MILDFKISIYDLFKFPNLSISYTVMINNGMIVGFVSYFLLEKKNTITNISNQKKESAADGLLIKDYSI